MSFKTILVHIDGSRHTPKRIDIAANLARKNNACLIGAVPTGISRYFSEAVPHDLEDPCINSYQSMLRQRAEDSLDQFKNVIQCVGDIRYETRLIDDDAIGGLSLHARYADLVVLGQFDPDDRRQGGQPYLLEYVAMNGGSPVLLVPYSNMASSIGERVLIAWNGSLEAKRAVHYALPLLQQAKSVSVVSFMTYGQVELLGDHPAADLASYLAYHSIEVDAIQEKPSTGVGDALLSLATDLSADLLVMGCYGRSRMREIILGGASRKIFQATTLPVLLSH